MQNWKVMALKEEIIPTSTKNSSIFSPYHGKKDKERFCLFSS